MFQIITEFVGFIPKCALGIMNRYRGRLPRSPHLITQVIIYLPECPTYEVVPDSLLPTMCFTRTISSSVSVQFIPSIHEFLWSSDRYSRFLVSVTRISHHKHTRRPHRQTDIHTWRCSVSSAAVQTAGVSEPAAACRAVRRPAGADSGYIRAGTALHQHWPGAAHRGRAAQPNTSAGCGSRGQARIRLIGTGYTCCMPFNITFKLFKLLTTI